MARDEKEVLLQEKMDNNKDTFLAQVRGYMMKQDDLLSQLLEAHRQKLEAVYAAKPPAGLALRSGPEPNGQMREQMCLLGQPEEPEGDVLVSEVAGFSPVFPASPNEAAQNRGLSDSWASPRGGDPSPPKSASTQQGTSGHLGAPHSLSGHLASSLDRVKGNKEQLRNANTKILEEAARVVHDSPARASVEVYYRSVMKSATKLLYSKAFDVLSSGVIVANTAFMAYQADHQAVLAVEGGVEDTATSSAIEVLFTSYYTAEIVLRLLVLQKYFFISSDCSWNFFDFFLACTAWYDVITSVMGEGGGGNLSFLRVMRLAKMLKLLRMIRLMRAFRELRLILNSVMSSVKLMFWAVVLIVAVAFMFGLCFVKATTTYINENKAAISPEELSNLAYRWGGVTKSIYTLYVASMGGQDWELFADSLKPVGTMFVYLFLGYIGFFFSVVTNTLTSLFVESAMSNADKDQQAVIQAELEQKDRYVTMLGGWYHDLDEDDSGDITLEEFMAHVEEPLMTAFAVAMDINITDVKQFFTVLSSNGRRAVDLETFIVGCIKLKGMAKAMDMIDLSVQCKQSHADLMELSGHCDERHGELRLSMASLAKSVEELRSSSSR